ncbi:MAG: phage tail tape measure protein [Asticcacaulis sp.]
MSDRSLRIQLVLGALDKLTGPLKSVSGQTAKATKALRDLRVEERAQQKELRELKNQIGAVGVPTREMAEHQRRLEDQIAQTNRQLDEQQTKVKRLGDIQRRNKATKELGGKISGIGAGAMGAGFAVGLPTYKAYEQARDLESALADVRKVMDFTPESFSRLSNDFLDMSTRVPMTAQALAQMAAAAGRAGVGQKALQSGNEDGARKEILQFTEDAAKMGVAFDISAEQAGETMAKWRTAFGLSQGQVGELGDQINALTNLYGGNAASVTDLITRIGPLGAVAGVSAAQLAGMGQLLDAVGVQSEVGATGVKNLMLTLTKGEAATKAQAEAFAALGLNAQAVAKNMQTDAGGTILDVLQRIQKLSPERQASILTRLFGSESVGAIAPLLTNLDKLEANFKLTGDSASYAGSMTQEYLSRIATAEGATGLAGNALQALNIKIGEQLVPSVTELSKRLVPILNGIREWADRHPKLTKAIAQFMAIGGGLLILFGGIALGLGVIAFAAGALGLALWPVLAVIAAVAALTVGILWLMENWEMVRQNLTSIPFFGPIIEDIIEFIDWVKDFAKDPSWARLGTDIIDGLVGGIKRRFGAVMDAMTGLGTGMKNHFKNILQIKSPSRVFRALGTDITDGLNLGLKAGQSDTLGRMRLMAGAMTGALSLGLTAPAMATSVSGGAGAFTGPITINIYAQAGQSPTDIAKAVQDELARLQRTSVSRARSGYGDDAE